MDLPAVEYALLVAVALVTGHLALAVGILLLLAGLLAAALLLAGFLARILILLTRLLVRVVGVGLVIRGAPWLNDSTAR